MNQKTNHTELAAYQQCGRIRQPVKAGQNIGSASQFLGLTCICGRCHAAGKRNMRAKIGTERNESHRHVCPSGHSRHSPCNGDHAGQYKRGKRSHICTYDSSSK